MQLKSTDEGDMDKEKACAGLRALNLHGFDPPDYFLYIGEEPLCVDTIAGVKIVFAITYFARDENEVVFVPIYNSPRENPWNYNKVYTSAYEDYV